MGKNSPIRAAVTGLSLGTTLNPLNSSMFAVALLVLREDFGLDLASVTWIITSFYLCSAVAQPVLGRLADRFGPRGMFIIGMAVVAATCALAPFSPNFATLCVARTVMALGTAAAYPCAVVMIAAIAQSGGVTAAHPLGRMQMANTIAVAVGPVIGGALIGLVGWRGLFLVNIPMSLAALLIVGHVAPADDPPERGSTMDLVRGSDLPGVLSFIIALLLLMIAALNAVPSYRWWMLGAGASVALLFVWRECSFSRPFLDLRLMGNNRPLMLVYLGFLLLNCVYYFVFFGLPQLLLESAGYEPHLVGLLMLPLAVMSGLSVPWAVKAMGRFAVRPVLITGVLLLTAGSVMMWHLTSSMFIPLVLALTAVMGAPYGIVSIAYSQGLFFSTGVQERGVAAGIFQTCRYVGAMTATVALGTTARGGVNQVNWNVIVLVMTLFSALAVAVALFWKETND